MSPLSPHDYGANLTPSGRDMVPPLDLSPISTKRGSLEEHIIRRQHLITRALGAEASYNPSTRMAFNHSRLTALELKTLEIPSTMIVDTMVGSLFQHHKIHAVGVSDTIRRKFRFAYDLLASCRSRSDSRKW
jgi:hypothetical protein